MTTLLCAWLLLANADGGAASSDSARAGGADAVGMDAGAGSSGAQRIGTDAGASPSGVRGSSFGTDGGAGSSGAQRADARAISSGTSQRDGGVVRPELSRADAGTASSGSAVAADGNAGTVDGGGDAGTVPRRRVLSITPGTPRPGDLVLVTFYTDDRTHSPTGALGGRPLHFFSFKHGFRALAPLSVDQPVGQITLELSPARGEPYAQPVDVVEPHFRESELKVANKFISPPKSVKAQIAEDKKAFAAAFNQPFIAPLFTRNFAWPRAPVVTAPFGDRRIFNGKLQSQHYGTDLDGKTGDEISAGNDGVVVLARSCYASGNTVLLHHGVGLFTAYFHMSKMDVVEGQKVKRGQHLGLVGKTGRVTGPHLHWGAKVSGMYVDAESLMRLDFEE
ncbi:MAG: peptidoglycan DD-metalloendopeptidase family protein [Myxococcaceae bacterium]